MTLRFAIPALPVRDIHVAVSWYAERLGFTCRHEEPAFAILVRDEVEIHLWQANDPTCAGAEPWIAGTASCRIRVDGLAELFNDLVGRGSGGIAGPTVQPWGDSDFTVPDCDCNAITFFEPG